MNRIKLKDVLPYCLMIPAISIGTLTMILYGVTSNIWLQNILIWIITSLLGCVFIAKRNKSYLSKNNFLFHIFMAIFIILLLMVPFLFNGLNGVHRWVAFGPIRFYIASIFLPLLIISLWNLLLTQRIYFVLALTSIALLILLFHPDASQASAFAIATVVILCGKIPNKLLKIFYLVFIAIAIILAWIFLDSLTPVPYVEQIVFLVADRGSVWLISGVLSLILLLLPFFLFNKNTLSISLGVYFVVTILATFIGNFPVPVMGYGTSPIIGYSIAVTLLTIKQRQ